MPPGAMRLTHRLVAEWPPLAWLAVCDPSSPDVTCFVGDRVETSDQWCCEAVWSLPFGSGDLDRTDLVFGSGIRLRDGKVVFVTSGSTLDRLQSIERDGQVLVSNSLPLLLAAVGGSLDIRRTDYLEIFNSIVDGLRRYERDVPTTAGPVRLTYFDNLAWDRDGLHTVEKPAPVRDFGSFTAYRHFLSVSMAALAANATAPERRHPFTLSSTLSSGYDSSASTVLAREAGCRETFGFDRARGGGDDSGRAAAHALGLSFRSVDTSAWQSTPEAAIPFLAAGNGSGADVFFHGAAAHLRGRVVFTGFHGDKVWDQRTEDLSPWLVRGDVSGSDLTEYRLGAGFINCPVPFWGARQIGDIHAISTSSDLAHWDIPGKYSRPICRRIVEEAGVPRDAFGLRKEATTIAILRPIDFLPPALRRAYFGWLRRRRRDWVRRGRLPPMPGMDALIVRVDTLIRRLSRWLATRLLRGRRGGDAESLEAALRKHRQFRRRRIHAYVIHWAIDRQKERYAAPLSHGIARSDAARGLRRKVTSDPRGDGPSAA